MICIFNIVSFAQNNKLTFNGYRGLNPEFSYSGALISDIMNFHIVGQDQFKETKYSLMIDLNQSTVGSKSEIKPGYYYFHPDDKNNNQKFTPFAYLIFDIGNNEHIIYATREGISKGYIFIESIANNRVVGKYKLEVYSTIAYDDNKYTLQGSFDLSIKNNYKNNQSTTDVPPTNSKSIPNIDKKYTLPIGFFDLQFSPGVNWTKPKKNMIDGEFGVDLDAGLTFLNLVYRKTYSMSLTAAMHYAYVSHNFDEIIVNSLHLRRQEAYIRIKPFGEDVTLVSNYNRVIGIILSGLYVDCGYTRGLYFNKGLSTGKSNVHSLPLNTFWGWGCNLTMRYERVGFSLTIGSKWYNFDLNNLERKYKSRTIGLGVTYSLVWNE